MTQDINTLVAELDALRLPELKERYQAVLGIPTRCPNRTFLIRSICNAARTQGEQAAAAEQRAEPPPAEEPNVAPRAPDVAPIAAVAAAAPTQPADAPSAPKGRQRRPKVEQPPRGRFSSMTVEELQRKYVEIVGRPSASSHRGYLAWKIREAEKGRIPVGPRQSRARDADSADVKILPLRLEADTVEAMDEAWRSRGIKTRMEFLRRALGHYLTHIGAGEAAAKFGGNSAA